MFEAHRPARAHRRTHAVGRGSPLPVFAVVSDEVVSELPLAGKVNVYSLSLSVSALKRASPVSELPVPVRAGATVRATGFPSGSTTGLTVTPALDGDRHRRHGGRQLEIDFIEFRRQPRSTAAKALLFLALTASSDHQRA